MTGTSLSDKELAALQAIVGMLHGSGVDLQGKTLGMIIAAVEPSADWSDEMKAIIEMVKGDSALCSLKYVERKEFLGDPDGHQAFLFEDSAGNPIVVFEGTQNANDVVQDAAILAGTSEAQKRALDYINDVYSRYQRPITVTGHSLGGNLAKFVTVMSGCVCRCVAFNPLGFSDGFIEERRGEINCARNKITAYNQVGDNVSKWGNRIGNEVTVGGTLDGESNCWPLGFHGMTGFFVFWEDEDGNVYVIDDYFGLQFVATAVLDSSHADMPQTSAVRDFSDEKLSQFREIIRGINQESPLEFWNWDCWHQLEYVSGRLKPENYRGNIERYWRNVLDLHDTTIPQIEAIFASARNRDRTYAAKLNAATSAVSAQNDRMRNFLA